MSEQIDWHGAGKETITRGLARSGVEKLETLPVGTTPRSSHHRSSGERRGDRKRLTIFLQKTRKGHSQSGEHWNCCEGSFGETSERRGGRAHMGFAERTDTILTWTELNCCTLLRATQGCDCQIKCRSGPQLDPSGGNVQRMADFNASKARPRPYPHRFRLMYLTKRQFYTRCRRENKNKAKASGA